MKPPATRDDAIALPDPVMVYDRLAPYYPCVVERRLPYLEMIERQIVARVPGGSRSYLDVGTGDGRRALRIAREAALSEIVLVEPSAAMRSAIPASVKVVAARLEDLADVPDWPVRGFDVITCLWNVLGHIRPESARQQGLGQLRRLLSPRGALFLDVNHRYNVRSYGLLRTGLRLLHDTLRPSETRGDVAVRWRLDGASCATYGHVFTDAELRRLAEGAGLALTVRLIVDYESGQTRRLPFQGNLLYVLRRADGSS